MRSIYSFQSSKSVLIDTPLSFKLSVQYAVSMSYLPHISDSERSYTMSPLQYIRGDLFSAVSSSKTTILAHACNPFGLWGGGIANQFRLRYPEAYKSYKSHCKENHDLLGSCALIESGSGGPVVACLFTSDFNNTPDEILSYTKTALDDLKRQLGSMKNVEKSDSGHPIVNMPQINSGIFNVPWEGTEALLEECQDLSFKVYVLD